MKRKLDSQNNIFIDQFTFGEKVESPQATSLPVKLAVALLKDRKGEIKLDLPVTGSLDDPKFSVWRDYRADPRQPDRESRYLAFRAPRSCLRRRGRAELRRVRLRKYGHNGTHHEKARYRLKALHDRPSLKMDIEGHVDMENDRDGLKQLLFERKIKVQKLNEMVKKGEAAVPVDEVKLSLPNMRNT